MESGDGRRKRGGNRPAAAGRRLRSLVVLWLGGGGLIAGGLLLISLKLLSVRETESPGPSPRLDTTRATRAPAAPPEPRPEFVPPEVVLGRLHAASGEQATLEQGRQAVQRAADLYARGTPESRAEGHRHMLHGLDLIRRAGAVVPELRAYHEETVLDPLRRGDAAEAERRLASWLESFPGDTYALRLLADARYRARDWKGAIPVCEKILESRPRDAEVLKLLAIASHSVHRWARAAGAAERYLELEPRDIEGHELLAAAAFEMGDQEHTVRAVRDALELIGFPSESAWDAPDGPRARVLATAMRAFHRFRHFEDLARIAAYYRARVPDSLLASMAEGVARLELGDAAAAVPLLERALADPENRVEVSFQLGVALAKQGKHREAARHFASLLVEEPHSVRSHYQLGLALSRLERGEDAGILFERAKELAPSDREMRRATELAGAGDLAGAARARALGHVLRQEFPEAERALSIPALRDDPNALLAVADLSIRWLRLDAARRSLDRAAAAAGQDDPNVRANRLRVLWTSGERGEALRGMEALSKEPGVARGWKLELARWLLALERPRDVVSLVTPLRASAADREESLYLARAWLALGDAEAALGLLEAISRGDKRWDEWEVSAWLAQATARAGRDAEAAWKVLEQVPHGRRGTLAETASRLAVLERLEAEGKAGERAGELATLRQKRAAERDLRGRIRKLEDDVARARWESSAALRLDLADAYREAGERLKAQAAARLALWASPGSSRGLRLLARLQSEPGEVFERLATLRALVEQAPEDAAARSDLRALESRWLEL